MKGRAGLRRPVVLLGGSLALVLAQAALARCLAGGTGISVLVGGALVVTRVTAIVLGPGFALAALADLLALLIAGPPRKTGENLRARG